ncbi:Atu4866 domain-containing protein [Mesorhizobium sp. Cs1299R1N1]|uniref:Atu4866 domain-containing protein n=1 Tax=Mesorhizobium sp. Cs1299R1N1 TaxID=3015172 RepID=UPI00301D7490
MFLFGTAPVQTGLAQMNTDQKIIAQPAQSHPYAGMWVTADGHVRHKLLPNGRYDEARGTRESAYRGRYEVRGNHIDYWDDTGFTADGTFVNRVLHHGGMILYRKE